MNILEECIVVCAALVCIPAFAQTSATPPKALANAKISSTSSYPDYDIVRSVPFAHPQGIQLVADMYLPHGSGPFPAIVFIHGGGWRNGDRMQLRRQAAYMAAHGMVGMAIEYRLAPAHPFPAGVKDSRAAVEWLRKHATQYHVDPRRIAAVGSSSGGNLAADLGVESLMSQAGKGANVEAVVSFNGIYDLAAMRPTSMISDFLGKPCTKAQKVCRKASPTDHVRPGEPPFLILHGTDDKTAPYSQAAAFVKKLQNAGVSAQLYTAMGAPHTFWAEKRWYKPSQQAMFIFLTHSFSSDPAVKTASPSRTSLP
ncbi:MAG: alpha/beta hydrolase [Terriglobia bacterium]